MARTVWNDAPRYERDWKLAPGYYVTGDVAVRGEHGYITMLGRADDVVNIAGHRIRNSRCRVGPGFASGSSGGGGDRAARCTEGGVIKAFVVLRAGQSDKQKLQERLVEHVRRELGPIAAPSSINVVSALPKTRSGKIMRRYIKAKELGQDPGDISTMEA